MKIFLIPLVALFGALPALANFSDLMKTGDVHDTNFQSDEALKYYLPAEKLDPTNAGLLVKISRQYALRMNDLPKEADKIASCRKALAYAERAVASDPKRCDSHLSVAICLGRLTPYLGARKFPDDDIAGRGVFSRTPTGDADVTMFPVRRIHLIVRSLATVGLPTDG